MTGGRDPDAAAEGSGVNPGYAGFQIAKALTTSEEHEDPAIRQRAGERVAKWATVLRNILTGSVEYGSRTPVEGVPEWVTLEVVTGGFATGELLAGGPLLEHEKRALEGFARDPSHSGRRTLNTNFMTDSGLAELQDRLRTGCYDLSVPEEGALLVVAWLVTNGHAEEARSLIDELSPYFSMLRFYPIPLEQPRRYGSRVHVQDVAKTIEDLRRIPPNRNVLAQKESVEIWAPLHDRVVALFLETVVDGWPCRNYPKGWAMRAAALLEEYAALREEHQLCNRPERERCHHRQLRDFLGRCAHDPASLTGREVGRIRLILERYVEKRGAPGSPACVEARRRQAADVSAPTFHSIAAVVVPRLEQHPRGAGLDDVGHVEAAVSDEEAARSGVPEGTLVPPSIQRKIERCLNETVEALVERGLITSGEALAPVLPQMTSGLRAAAIADVTLRQLYAAIYRAFRRRRSLLLLDLEKQVQIEALPWVAAIDRFRTERLSTRELARQALEEITTLTLTSFPYAILPNKLVQELRALAVGAGLDIPLVDEIAADIFRGAFTGKFLESARRAGELLNRSLYATYYGIDYAQVASLPGKGAATARPKWFWRKTEPHTDAFVRHCASRAGVPLGTWDAATNGMIIEQQQILTTQNLAALFVGLRLDDALRSRLRAMAEQCFVFICRRQQVRAHQFHARLIMLKNTAYAWRQMVFFLSLAPAADVTGFLHWGEDHLEAQSETFRNRFRPAWNGLALAADGRALDGDDALAAGARRFLGWSMAKHWLLADIQDP